MPIIGNAALNKDILPSIAAKLSSDISQANDEMDSAIQKQLQ